MKAHIIENGIVVNTIVVDSLDFMPNLVEATEGAIGWLYSGGVFTNPNALTQQELDNNQAKNVRIDRDAILTETDWIVTKALETGNSVPSAMATYRQALRDITDHANFPYLAEDDWPVKP